MVSMADHTDIRREHGFHALSVKEIVQETDDTKTFVLDVPTDLGELFAYRPGQFCTVRVEVDGEEVLRCYSMSSAPSVDADLAVTVKRVPDGTVSNWLHDHVSVGDKLELLKPSGVFCPSDTEEAIVGFCGGSGVTPVFSIVKHTLATSQRSVRLLVANRDRASVIFHDELARLQSAYPGRFELRHHLDSEGGYLDPSAVREFVVGDIDAEMFVCGPTPFMDLVEAALSDEGVSPERIAIERFIAGGVPAAAMAHEPETTTDAGGDVVTETLTIVLKGKTHVLAYTVGDTVLDAARRGGLKPPFSCELGNCASCMALVCEGGARMRANNALTASEVDEGWVLTCQALPTGRVVKVEYENF
jgi:ferredoxin-NADP reductase